MTFWGRSRRTSTTVRVASGATALDIYAPTVNWNAQDRLAEGLAQAEHVLRIEVTGRKYEKSSNSYVQVVGFDVR